MTLVIVGAPNPMRMDEAVSAFEAAGFTRIDELDGVRDGDFVLGVSDGGAELLREADRRAIKYVLVHDGEDDHHDGGTFERAHHRIEAGQRGELAEHLRSRERPLITCLAFGCTGGRHRSVVLAGELAERLREIEGIDVDFVTRDID